LQKTQKIPAQKSKYSQKKSKIKNPIEKMEIILEQKNGNSQDLPGDKRNKLAGKLGASIFLIEESTIKSEILKTQVKFRSYKECPIRKAEMHVGPGNIKGLLLNGDMFISGKNTKFAGEEGSNASKKDGEQQQGGDKNFLIALDEKSAKKYAVEFNVLQRESVRGMIKQLQKTEELIDQVIEADSNVAAD